MLLADILEALHYVKHELLITMFYSFNFPDTSVFHIWAGENKYVKEIPFAMGLTIFIMAYPCFLY